MSSVTLVFDLRYTDWELFDSTRDICIRTVGEMVALSRAAAFVREEPWLRVEVFAANASRLIPVCDTARDANASTDAMRVLRTLDPVRSPNRDTDHCVVDAVKQLLHSSGNFTSGDSRRSLFFFTSFTTINDFSRIVHSAKVLSIPFMDNVWVSLHLDATAMTTTLLALTPSIRSIRCPIAPLIVRSAIQQALSPFFDLQHNVSVSLRFGRYTVPCTARRSYFMLPTRCCTADDFAIPHESGGSEESSDETGTVLLTGRHVCTSQFERERWIANEVVLAVEGIVGGEDVGEELLHGDGWMLAPRESTRPERSPEEWMYHLSKEVGGDVLLLTTRQPHLDPPHQLALPSTTFVGFFLRPTHLYLRPLIPPELLAVGVESVGECCTRYRHDTALSDEIKKTADELRTSFALDLCRKPVGVSRVLAQLKTSQQFTLRLEKSQAPMRRGSAHPLHNLHR